MAKTNRTNVALYPAQSSSHDGGLPDAVWNTLYCTRLDVYSRTLTLSTIGRLSAVPGLGPPPADEDVYMAVVGGRWQAIVLSDWLPPPAAPLASDTMMSVVGGMWEASPRPYILPQATLEGAWLTALDGSWKGFVPEAGELPEVDRAADQNRVLTVVAGAWDKGDFDNFYLPWPDAITPEVPHAAAVAGAKWLKRPLAAATVSRRGLLPAVPGDPALAFHGDGRWRDARGEDYGRWRVGDVRRTGVLPGGGWLPLDGGTIGRLDNADHSGVLYHALYMRLHPDARDWEDGVRVVLDNLPGHEILAAGRIRHPADITVFTGPAAGGPYLLQLSGSPDFAEVLFESDSALDASRWSELAGVLVCGAGGATREDYARYGEPVSPTAAIGTGFFHTRWRPSAGGPWRYGSAWATEEDVLRLDTVTAAGVSTGGVMTRPPPFRAQIPLINGRPVHAGFARQTSEAHGVGFATDTSALDGGRLAHRMTARDGSTYDVPDPVRFDAFRGVEMQMYGAGDMAPERAYTVNPQLRPVLDQLAVLDGYAADAPPRHWLRRLEYGVDNKKWWGGVVGADGNIYLVPHFAKFVLVIEPKTGRMHEIGNFAGSRGRWSGGVLAPDGKLYCFPYNETRFLIVDTATRRTSYSALGLSSAVFRDNAWAGGCLSPDGTIRAFPLLGMTELVIDYVNQRATAYDMTPVLQRQMSDELIPRVLKHEHPILWYNDVALNLDGVATPWLGAHTAGARTMYGGAVLASDGAVRAVPCGNWILEQLRTDEKRDWYPELPRMPLLAWSMYKREWKGYPGSAMPVTAVSASPLRLVDFDMYDRANNGGPDRYADGAGRGGNFTRNKVLVQNRNKYLGGVLAPDGNNYFIPCGGSPDVLVAPAFPADGDYNDIPSVSFRVPDARYANCRGGVLGPDGNIYSASADGTAAFALTPRTRQLRTVELPHPRLTPGRTAWMGAVTGPDGWVYFVPHDSEYLLIVDPCVPAGPWPAEMNQYFNKF